ncbi:MAG: sensor of ECF-type sigma factor [Gelidibacter sp.]
MRRLIITLLLLTSLNSFSQDNDRHERIKALKVAFITERLELTTTEAQQFWPIYNTFEDENNKLRKQSYENRKSTDFDALTEQEAKAMLNDMISIENKKQKLRDKFLDDLLKVLPAKKIILLKVTEDAFNKRMLEEMKKRRDGFRKN